MTIDKIAEHYSCSKSCVLGWVDKGLTWNNKRGTVNINISDLIKWITNGKA